MARKRTNDVTTTQMHWSEVKRKFIQCVQTGVWGGPAGDSMEGQARDWNAHRSDPKAGNNAWAGGAPDQTIDWLKNGYFSDEFEHAIGQKHNIEATTIVWNEDEGDVEYSRMIAGYDDVFLGVVQAPSMSGIKLLIDFDFNCNVGVGVIRAYGAFCSSLINALMESGFDTEIDICIETQGLFQEEAHSHVSRKLIRVKEFGEVLDFTEFSALFAPTGFRHLNFTAIGLACDKENKTCSYGLGRAVSHEWGLEYDEDNRVVHLHCSGHEDKFPGTKMVEAAIEAGIM